MIRHGQVSTHSAPLATTGALAIALGLAVYALARSARIPLVPPALHFAPAGREPALFGSLPSALHAFAMPLLTLACLRGVRRSHVFAICLGWITIDVLFELAQRYRIAHFPSGTFDPGDVLGVFIGASLSCGIALAFIRSRP